MSTVNGFQVGSETLKYNYESLDNYNTPNFSTSSSTTYAVGDYVMYNGKLYKCTTATTGGTWVGGNWTEAVLSDDVSDLSRQISDVEGAFDFTKDKLNRYAIAGTHINGINQYGYASLNGTIWKVVNNSSTSWVQNKYEVHAGYEYIVSASLTKQADGIAGIYFTDSFEINTVVEVIEESKTAEINKAYTPTKDGYIVVLMSVGGNVRAASVMIAEVAYKDFQGEIDVLKNTLIIEEKKEFEIYSGYVSSETGEIVTPGGYYTQFSTDGIYKIRFKTNPFGGNYGYGFVLSDNTWVGYHTTSIETKEIDVPEGAVTFKTCWSTNYITTQEIYVHVLVSIKDDIKPELDKIYDSQIIEKDVVFTTLTGSVSSETGEITGDANYCQFSTDGIIELRFKINPFGGNYGYGFVMDDDSWVGYHTTTNETIRIKVPEGAVTFKTCWSTNYITNQKITSFVLADLQTDIYQNLPKTLVPFPFNPSFDLSIVPNIDVVTMTHKVSEIYDLYDGLVTEYPEWVTKVDCSDADTPLSIVRPSYLDGLPIYLYKFSPKRVGLTDPGNRIKFFIVTGTHPNEEMGIFNVFYMMNTLLSMWKTNETCAQLRTMFDFVIIPCISPWGYEHQSRVNYNGVNLNRNFPTKNWAVSGSGTEDYTGPTAGSEYETKIAMYYIQQENPNLFWDAHTGGMTNAGRYGCIDIDIWSPEYIRDICVAMSRAMTNAWIAENSDFPQTPETTLFDTNISDVGGEEFRWVSENITEWAFLTEESVVNNYVNGVLYQTTQEVNTPRIWRENLQAVYNTTIRMLHGLCQQYYLRAH